MATQSYGEYYNTVRNNPQYDSFSDAEIEQHYSSNFAEKYEVEQTGDFAAGLTPVWLEPLR